MFITCVLACGRRCFVNKTFLLGEEVALYCAKYLPDIIKDQKAYKEGKLQKVCLSTLLILHLSSWRVLPHFLTVTSLCSHFVYLLHFFLKESCVQNKLLPSWIFSELPYPRVSRPFSLFVCFLITPEFASQLCACECVS